MIELIAFNEHRVALAVTDYLKSLGIECHIEIEHNRFAVLLKHDSDVERARQEVEGFLANPQDARYWRASWQTGQKIEPSISNKDPNVKSVLKELWSRGGLITLSVVVMEIVAYILFTANPTAIFPLLSFPEHLPVAHYQYWRLLTPVFLHAGILHILFNIMWWWDLAGLIERIQSKSQLLGVFIATALVSNFYQYLETGSNHFGGLSGVVYGLLGYIWCYLWVNPTIGLRLRWDIVLFMVGWLLIGYSGILDNVVGHIANDAHLAGLLAGCALGVGFGLLQRFSAKPSGS